MTPDEAYDAVYTLRQLANRLEAMAARRNYRSGDMRRPTDSEWRRVRADVANRLREITNDIDNLHKK